MCAGAAAVFPPLAIGIVGCPAFKLGQVDGRRGIGVDVQGHVGGLVVYVNVVGSGAKLEGIGVVHRQSDIPGVLVDIVDALSVLSLHLGDVRLGGGGSHSLQVDLHESAQGVGLGADQEVDNVLVARVQSPACVVAGDELEELVGSPVIPNGRTGIIYKKLATAVSTTVVVV